MLQSRLGKVLPAQAGREVYKHERGKIWYKTYCRKDGRDNEKNNERNNGREENDLQK